MKKSLKKNIIIYSIITIIIALIVLVESVNLNPLYPQSMFFYLLVITAYAVTWLVLKLESFSLTKLLNKEIDYHTANVKKSKKKIKVVIISIIALWVIYFGIHIYSIPIIHAYSYRDQLSEPVTKEFTSDMQTLDVNQIPIVDSEYAYNLADKKIGETPSLGSQVKLGEPVIQNFNGELVWVVPLHHSGFFKWISNMDGTPGYIKVSATNFRDVEYVKDFKIKYQPSSYFFDRLERHVRFNGALFAGVTDMSFEIDDAGVPYWVVTEYKNTVGFTLPEATGVFLVNAQTGEMQRYNINEMPSWVDRVQPEQFIVNQINNRGKYINGFWNFSDKDKFKTSAGERIIYNNNKCYLFTGITSIGGDDSAMGFMMVDMVTKEPIYYKMSGATENAAMQSAQQKIAHLNYRASFPIILNLNSNPTYFMTMKDAEGLVKQYAFVSVKEHSIVGVDEDINKALESYNKSLSNSGSANISPEDEQKAETINGTVARIASEIVGNETVYKIILNEKPGLIFTVNAAMSHELALTMPNDLVSIDFAVPKNPDEKILSIKKFDNTLI